MTSIETPGRRVDGRVLRGERTRASILIAARNLIDATNTRPRVEDVATLAKVALRSVYHHFSDKDELVRHALALEPRRTLVITIEPADAP